MAKILVLTHAHDLFHRRDFLVKGLFVHWVDRGHEVIVHEGPTRIPQADVIFLHVDQTQIPEPYLAAVRSARVVINGKALDIGKRVISEQLVPPGSTYDGPVIVKTNANAGGIPEWLHAEVGLRKGETAGPPVRHMTERYPIFDSPALVPPSLRLDPDLVVEKFLPEQDERGYYSRHWVFLGDRERCNRVLGPHPVVKAADVIERVPVDVPDELRAWRRRFGFDYGKFDFVVRDGKPVLFDVNRTPTLAAHLREELRAGMAELAKGIEGLLE